MRRGVRTGGFTLFELVVVTALMGVVAITLYSVFASGMKIWDRLNTHSEGETITLFFHKLSADLRNSFPYRGMEFVGDETSLSFATLLIGNEAVGGGGGVGRIAYRFDEDQKTIARGQEDMSDIYEEEEGRQRVVLEGVGSVQFRYYYYDMVEEAYLWQETWPPKLFVESVDDKLALPAAVEIELNLDDASQKGHYAKRIFVPTGR